VQRLVRIGREGSDYRPLARCIDEKAIVNAAVGLLASGGSTNHAIHLPAIARAAGIHFDWEDLDSLSRVVPLLARIYPNGSGDINSFHNAGGIGFVIRELLDAGLIHSDIVSVADSGFEQYALEPSAEEMQVAWKKAPTASRSEAVLLPAASPFRPDGGMCLVRGNLGRAIFKTSAVDSKRWRIEAPCRCFDEQNAVLAAFAAGELDRDLVVVVRFQGPCANGMPELHRLMPALSVLQDRGYRIALVTDGRLSGASGKVPAALHVTPEAVSGGGLALLRDGDEILLCADERKLEVRVPADEWARRTPAPTPGSHMGMGRELFALMRRHSDCAEAGASALLAAMEAE
jgi:phosphogluconate dehydratase